MNEKLGPSEIKRTPLLVEFTEKLSKEVAEIKAIRLDIQTCLHRLKNTNYPTASQDCTEETRDYRGNSDLEEKLFKQLDDITEIRRELQIDLEKLETLF